MVSEPRQLFRDGSPYSDIAQQRITDFRQGFVAYGLIERAKV